MHSDLKMKLGEKIGWYLIALTAIIGFVFFATIIAFFATDGFGPDDVIIAHVENGHWSVKINCPLGVMTPDVTIVTAEQQTSWWARQREILWVGMGADSARVTFSPVDSVKVALWFGAQERNYSLSLLSETMVRDTFDLWNKNRPE